MFTALPSEEKLLLTKTLGKLGISQAKNLWEATSNTWKDFDEKLTRLRGTPLWLRDLTAELITTISMATWISEDSQVDLTL